MREIQGIDWSSLACVRNTPIRGIRNKVYRPASGAWMQLQMDEKNAAAVRASVGDTGLDVRTDFANGRMFIRAGGRSHISYSAGGKRPPYISISSAQGEALEELGEFTQIPADFEVVRVGNELAVLVELDTGRMV